MFRWLFDLRHGLFHNSPERLRISLYKAWVLAWMYFLGFERLYIVLVSVELLLRASIDIL